MNQGTVAHNDIEQAIDAAYEILGNTYGRDEEGNWVDEEGDYSGADIVEQICGAGSLFEDAHNTIHPSKKLRKALAALTKRAKELYETDDVNIDPLRNATEISDTEGEGIWVRAWVHVPGVKLENEQLKETA